MHKNEKILMKTKNIHQLQQSVFKIKSVSDFLNVHIFSVLDIRKILLYSERKWNFRNCPSKYSQILKITL